MGHTLGVEVARPFRGSICYNIICLNFYISLIFKLILGGTSTTVSELEIQKQMLNALQAPEKTPDGVDGFLLLMGEGLRRLPLKSRSRLQIKFLQLLQDEEDRLETESQQ